ncbi:BTAD domain-containing putative transcriptional regulator [Virgisporangium ochraceum]
MRIRVLGTVRAVDGDGRVVALGPHKQRLLLTTLARRPSETIQTFELVDAMWGDTPPPSAGENLRAYVRGLRTALGPDIVVGQRRTGYALMVDPFHVDAVEFSRSVRDGATALRLGDPAAARNLLHHALALWHGPPFADIEPTKELVAESARLEEQRLAALEGRIDADLQCGLAGEVVPELDELTRRYPYRERLHELLMVALYRSGRQADALAAYRRARDLFIDELGVVPRDQLRGTEQAILRREPWLERPAVAAPVVAARAVPAELPATVSGFAGRDAELAWLDRATAPVLAIVGTAGVGKTALAVHWAHRAIDRFPDGQVFLDLRGFHPGTPLRLEECLARLLRAFDAEPSLMPPSIDEAAAMFRSAVARRRALIVLDNALSADQVRPLLPGNPDCVVLVTSRNRMAGLVAHNAAAQLALDPLSAEGALDLLRHALAPSLVHTEPAAATDLARACGNLPLAMRIAAANVAENPDRSLAEHLADLRGRNRLDALRVDGDEHLAVRAAFDLSYAALTADQQRLFRLVGLVPGHDIAPPAAAALAGWDVDRVRDCLDRLAAAHLLRHGDGDRYSMHDLLREYARSRGLADDPADRAAALDRLFTGYVQAGDAAARALVPVTLRLLTSERASRIELDRDAAQAWCEAELQNLVAACEYAAEHGPAAAAWLISDAMTGYCWLHRNLTDWVRMAGAAHRAAAAAGDPKAQASAAISLGRYRYEAGDLEASARHFEDALRLSREAGWSEAEGTILSSAGKVHGALGRLDRAVGYQETALEVHRRAGQRLQEAVALAHLGMTSAWQGRLVPARDAMRGAVDLLRAEGFLPGLIFTLANLSDVLSFMDDRSSEREVIGEAVRIAAGFGQRTTDICALLLRSRLSGDVTFAAQAQALLRLPGDQALAREVHRTFAAVHERSGNLEQAVAHHRIAHMFAATVGDRHEEIQSLIGLATAEHRMGEPTADISLRRALAGARAVGYRILEGQAVAALARISADRGDGAGAAVLAADALRVQDETGWRVGRAELVRLRD